MMVIILWSTFIVTLSMIGSHFGVVLLFLKENEEQTSHMWSLFSVCCMQRFLLNSFGVCRINHTHSNKIYCFKYRKMLIFYKNGLCFQWVQIWSWSKLKTWNKLVLIQILKEITERGLVSKDNIQRL